VILATLALTPFRCFNPYPANLENMVGS